MTVATATIVIAAFLSCAATAIFVMLAAGIRAGDRPHGLTGEPNSHLEALARTVLGVGIRTGHLASGEDGEKD